MAAATKQTTKLGKDMHTVDTEFIHARVIGIVASSRETISIETLFSQELAPHPTALFMDACALLWTVPWPALPAKVSAFVNAAVSSIMERVETSCVYNLTEDSPLPKQALVLNVSANKKQVIQMIVDKLCSAQILHGKCVVITDPEPHPVQVGIGEWQTSITHEEADVIMAYHVVQEARAGHSPIRVISDDTDVLLILVNHLHAHVNSLPHSVQVGEQVVGNLSGGTKRW